jgi:hypothetical protein
MKEIFTTEKESEVVLTKLHHYGPGLLYKYQGFI